MTDPKMVQAAEPTPQVLDEEIKEKELDSRASPNVSNSESEVLQVELSDFRLIILGAAFLALWATNATSILQTAMILPVIAEEFGVSKSQVQWVAASNTIVWGSLQIIAGRCCDIYGRKRAFHFGMACFFIATLLSAFMPNLPGLNVCRGISAIGQAVTNPAAAGMIGMIYPAGRKRVYAYVAISAGGVTAASFGLILAGVFVEYSRWTWRPCYFAIAIVALWPWAVVTGLVPNDPPHNKDHRLDWVGSLLLGLSLFLLLFGFTSSQTEDKGWAAPHVPVLLVSSVIMFMGFVLRQVQLTRALGTGTKAKPLIPRALLCMECWDLLILYISVACAFGSNDSWWALISYLYFDVLKLRPIQAGLRLGVVWFSGLTAALAVALLIERISPRALISIFCGFQVASPVLMAVRRLDWPFWYADLWAILPVAFNTDVLIAAGLVMVSLIAPVEDGSVAAAMFQTSGRIGYAIGFAIATLTQTNIEAKALQSGKSERDASGAGLQAGFWFCVALSLISTLVVLLGMRGWRKLSEMKQGEESPVEQEVNESTVVPGTSAA